MISTNIDPVFYLEFDENKRPIGINGFYVYDLLRARKSKFKKLREVTHQKFETAPDEHPAFSFACLE